MAEGEKSRRSIDLFTASQWGELQSDIRILKQQATDAYEAIYGGKHQVGLAEQMRGMLKIWGTITVIASGLLGSWTWIYDKLKGAGDTPMFGDQVQEKWKKQSTKRVRLFNKQKGVWEYYYMLEESRPEAIERAEN